MNFAFNCRNQKNIIEPTSQEVEAPDAIILVGRRAWRRAKLEGQKEQKSDIHFDCVPASNKSTSPP